MVGNSGARIRKRGTHSSYRPVNTYPYPYNCYAPKKPIVPPVRVNTPAAPYEWFPRAFCRALTSVPTAAACTPAVVALFSGLLGVNSAMGEVVGEKKGEVVTGVFGEGV